MLLKPFFKNRIEQVIFIKKLKNLPKEIYKKNNVFIASSITPFFFNWGDDISAIIAQFIAPNKNIIHASYAFNIFNKKEVLCVGSIISWLTKPNSVIWGSGIQFPDEEIIYKGKVTKPHKVYAVRGPLTRQYLIDRGIECPEIYGDPAILFPKFYTPKISKKYKIGILPHFKDKNSSKVKELLKLKGTHFIDVQDCKDWRTFINEINSCEFILSSTLHGVIIADSYGIPNAWVEYEQKGLKRFTFQDYFLSVKKEITEPENIDFINSYEDFIPLIKKWKKPEIDTNKLLAACPFK